MLSRIRDWLRARKDQKLFHSRQELVLNRLSTALFPLERTAVRQMFGEVVAFSDVVREDYEAGASPERTTVTLLTAVLPTQFASLAPAERQTAVLTALEDAVTGPWQDALQVIIAPTEDILVNLVRNLASRVRAWSMQGLVNEQECAILFHELSGAMRGLSPSERAAQRLDVALFDLLEQSASPALRDVLTKMRAHTDTQT